MLTAGGSSKTQNYKFVYYWPTTGRGGDFRTFTSVGQWVSQNMRVLDRKQAPECASLLAEQFPDLVIIEVAHANGPLARWTQ